MTNVATFPTTGRATHVRAPKIPTEAMIAAMMVEIERQILDLRCSGLITGPEAKVRRDHAKWACIRMWTRACNALESQNAGQNEAKQD